MNNKQLDKFIDQEWDNSVIPELIDYIRIPNKSPMFDPDWAKHGFMEKVIMQFVDWINRQEIPHLQLDIVRLPDRTPLIYIEIPGAIDNTVLLYGHLDKQPEMTGWRDDLGPWQPVLEGDRLYGRGGADDGYATFSSILALRALGKQNTPHARCVIIIEACEESGSYDLPHYIAHLDDRIGQPDLVICLDSGCGNYEQLWCTSSLRGLVGGILTIETMREGIHSGDASGIVPSSFRILRQLLDRLENPLSGEILASEFYVEIPHKRIEQAQTAANMLGDTVYERFPLIDKMLPVTPNPVELILNRSWRPALSCLGVSGLPDIQSAGNVLLPGVSVKLSMRLPPSCNARRAAKKMQEILCADPPYGARVTFKPDWTTNGWMAPEVSPWLEQAIDQASRNYFNKPAVHMGEGWSIPFMGMLGEKYPGAQFLITGVLGPESNAHGPNEFLHVPTAKKLTCCVAEIIARHFDENASQ